MAEKTRVCWTVIRPVLIERRSQAVTAPSRMNRTSKTGRCVVPPSISGAKTVRPPRTTREPKAGKERRAAGSCSGSIPHITNPKLLSDLQRSEEHTSELQSPYDLVCRLLLEKKK